MTNKNKNRKDKIEKLRGFENWSQEANLIQAILEKRSVRDIVNESRADPITAAQTRKRRKTIPLEKETHIGHG